MSEHIREYLAEDVVDAKICEIGAKRSADWAGKQVR